MVESVENGQAWNIEVVRWSLPRVSWLRHGTKASNQPGGEIWTESNETPKFAWTSVAPTAPLTHVALSAIAVVARDVIRASHAIVLLHLCYNF